MDARVKPAHDSFFWSFFSVPRWCSFLYSAFLHQLEPMLVGVAVVDEDGVEAGDAGPAFDAGDDRREVADLGLGLDAAVEQAADDALMDEIVADPQLALGGQPGQPRR